MFSVGTFSLSFSIVDTVVMIQSILKLSRKSQDPPPPLCEALSVHVYM